MAFKGKKFTIFGSYKLKKNAVASERQHDGSFILRRKVRGSVRYVVLKPRRRKR